MLVLSRKLGEKVYLSGPNGVAVVLTVVDIDRGKIRLGIEAPREIVVSRDELLSREERKAISAVAGADGSNI